MAQVDFLYEFSRTAFKEHDGCLVPAVIERSEVTAGEAEVIERSECQVRAERGHRWRSRPTSEARSRAKRAITIRAERGTAGEAEFIERSECSSSSGVRSPLAKPSLSSAASVQVRAERGTAGEAEFIERSECSSSSGGHGEAGQ